MSNNSKSENTPIDLVQFLEQIVRDHRQVENPREYLRWVARVCAFMLEQYEFELEIETNYIN